MLVGGWYMEDGEYEVSARRVVKIIESTSDPRSEYFDLMRRESLPAEELMGRRMETGVSPCSRSCGAKRNWHRIMREWVYADPPETELGVAEWDYFEARGVKRVPGAGIRSSASGRRQSVGEQARVVGADPVDAEPASSACASAVVDGPGDRPRRRSVVRGVDQARRDQRVIDPDRPDAELGRALRLDDPRAGGRAATPSRRGTAAAAARLRDQSRLTFGSVQPRSSSGAASRS